MQSKKIFEWCLKQGEKENHRGLKKIKQNQTECEKHVNKALHNLKAMDYNIKGGFSDWAVSAAFYSMYHSLLAILYKLGYESRNQECTITAIGYSIDKGTINFDKKYIEMIRKTSAMIPKDAKTLREEFQYGTEVSVDKEVLEELRKNAIDFVEKVQIVLEGL